MMALFSAGSVPMCYASLREDNTIDQFAYEAFPGYTHIGYYTRALLGEPAIYLCREAEPLTPNGPNGTFVCGDASGNTNVFSPGPDPRCELASYPEPLALPEAYSDAPGYWERLEMLLLRGRRPQRGRGVVRKA